MPFTRRSFFPTMLLAPIIMLRGSVGYAQDKSLRLPLTPSCGDEAHLTVAQTAGPFYQPNAPLKRDLLIDTQQGQRITLTGFVVNERCLPLPGSLIEIWHADHEGEYDNSGFQFRGHQFADKAGRWGFTTIVTQHYSFRTAHYHFRVLAPGHRQLTTQLYFPEHPRNAGDPLFDPRLVLRMSRDGNSLVGHFDFVV